MTADIAHWAEVLCPALVRSTEALAKLVKTRDEASIEEFEAEVDEVKQNWHSLMVGELTTAVGRGYDRIWKPGIELADWNCFIRMMVAFSGVISAGGAWISSQMKMAWGDHIFAAADFPLLKYDSISRTLPPNAVSILLPETTGDFAGAFIDVSNLCRTDAFRQQTQVQQALVDMCSAVGAGAPAAGLGFRCWPQSEVERSFGWNTKDVVDAVDNREIVAVQSWTGKLEFPDYQFSLGHTPGIDHWVSYVLKNTPDSFEGWPLAIWLGRNRAKPDDFYRIKLTERGLWTPEWGTPPAEIFAKEEGCTDKKKISKGRKLWRVSPSAISPFLFAQADMPNAHSKGKMRPSGRFDVDRARSNKGSLYLSETPVGAWREVLDREPVVTLRHLTSRDAWCLRPHRSFTLVDLAHARSLVSATSRRADTQDLATKYALAGRQGLRVRLRTGGGWAVVLFGTAGKWLPSPGGLGGWSAERVPGVQGPPLWEYLADRMTDPDLATVLRRLPGDLILLS